MERSLTRKRSPRDRWMTVLFRPSSFPRGATYRLTTSPIRASVLCHYSAYFESILWRNDNDCHTILAPPQQYAAFKRIFAWLLRCQQTCGTATLPTRTKGYTSLALLYQSARMLEIRVLEQQLRIKLERRDVDHWEIQELLSKVEVTDIAVQLVVKDLAKKYVQMERQHDRSWMKKIADLVRNQGYVTFETAVLEAIQQQRASYSSGSLRFPPLHGALPAWPHLLPASGARLIALPEDKPWRQLSPAEVGFQKVRNNYGDARLEWVRSSQKHRGIDPDSCLLM